LNKSCNYGYNINPKGKSNQSVDRKYAGIHAKKQPKSSFEKGIFR
jgi:hypothetical protein